MEFFRYCTGCGEDHVGECRKCAKGKYYAVDGEDTAMNYFQVSFSYPGPKCNIHIDRDSDVACSSASNKLDLALHEAGIIHAHAYSWPDGSLYYYIATELEEHELHRQLNLLLKPHGIMVGRFYPADPDELYKSHEGLTLRQRLTTKRMPGGLKLEFFPSWKLTLKAPSANPEDHEDVYTALEDGDPIGWFPEEEDAKTFIRAKRKEWGYDKLAVLLKDTPLEFGEDV